MHFHRPNPKICGGFTKKSACTFPNKVALKPLDSLLALSNLPDLSLPMYPNCVRVGICTEATNLAVDYITVENFFSIRIVRSYSIEHAHSCRF